MLILTKNEKTELMYVMCTCGKETSFATTACPLICQHCDAIFPDALNLHQIESKRVAYHTDKEIFD